MEVFRKYQFGKNTISLNQMQVFKKNGIIWNFSGLSVQDSGFIWDESIRGWIKAV